MRRLILFLRTMSDPIISAYNHIIYKLLGWWPIYSKGRDKKAYML